MNKSAQRSCTPIDAGNPAKRVIRKLHPQAPGARRWAATYGEQLMCVRYRVDPQRQRRLTAVELAVDEGAALKRARVQVGVRVAWGEKALGRTVRAAGCT